MLDDRRRASIRVLDGQKAALHSGLTHGAGFRMSHGYHKSFWFVGGDEVRVSASVFPSEFDAMDDLFSAAFSEVEDRTAQDFIAKVRSIAVPNGFEKPADLFHGPHTSYLLNLVRPGKPETTSGGAFGWAARDEVIVRALVFPEDAKPVQELLYNLVANAPDGQDGKDFIERVRTMAVSNGFEEVKDAITHSYYNVGLRRPTPAVIAPDNRSDVATTLGEAAGR